MKLESNQSMVLIAFLKKVMFEKSTDNFKINEKTIILFLLTVF